MRRVLCVVEAVVPSTEISIIRPFGYLAQHNRLVWQLIGEKEFSLARLAETDLVVFHRTCEPSGVSLLQETKQAGLPVIYELDDDFLEMPADTPIGRYMRLPPIAQAVQNFLRLADIVKVGSPEMVAMAAKFNQHVVCHPYAVDLSLVEGVAPRKHEGLIVGYAATIHHTRDFAPLARSLFDLAAQFPRLEFDFIGCLPESLQGLPRLTFTKFIPDYALFLRSLCQRGWDLGLAPLADEPHNRCKTANKLREYGACRIPGIYSNIPPYVDTVQSGVTGLLVENTEEAWANGLRTMLQDAGLRSRIARDAHQWVEQHRSLAAVAEMWETLFAMAIKQKGVKPG